MEDALIIKKIFINDYIINTTLLDKSLFNLLVRTLSSKFYKTDKIEYKVNNILKNIDNIFYNNSGNKIFNLAYQPYNQYNIISDYKKSNFNKKWIIPIVNEKKILNQKILQISKDSKYDNENKLLLTRDSIKLLYNDQQFDDFPEENDFYNSDSNLKKLFINILDSKNQKEFEVLEDETIYNSNTSISSSTDCKIIREPNKHNYYIYSDNIPTKGQPKIYNKLIKDSINQVRNILKGENINITKFLILNPIKLLTSNYNISIGNTMSYLGEILYNNNNIDININTNINDIINNSQNKLESKGFFPISDTDKLEYYTVDSDEFMNEYNNKEGYVWDYLGISQNIDKINANNEIISIKILKHIYNLFGYDLNKIPFCYLRYLKNILHNNISYYIFKNTVSVNNSLLDLFNKYVSEKTDTIKTEFTLSVQKLYNIEDIENIENIPENNLLLYIYLLNNTSDRGSLFYLDKYVNYLRESHTIPKKIVDIKEKIEKPLMCKNYRIVKTYNILKEYEDDDTKFVDSEYSEENYLIEYSDLMGILNTTDYSYEHNIYKLDTFAKINPEKNKLDVKKSHINKLLEGEFTTFIENNKLYLYNLLFNKSDIELDILFNKLACFKYENKHYVQIPIQTITDFNIIYIQNENKFYYFENNTMNPINEDYEIEYINKQYIKNCEDYNKNEIEINNLESKKQFYDALHNLNSNDNYKKTTELLLNNLRNKNIFTSEIVKRTREIQNTQIHFKNLPLIEYTITNYNNPKMYNDFITNLSNNINSDFKSYSLNDMKNEIDLYDNLSPSIKNIKNVDKQINLKDPKNELWGTIHRYINEYEIFHTHIIENPEKHTRAYYKMRELLIDDDIILRPDFKLISLAEAPGYFVNCIKDMVSIQDWQNYKIYTSLLDKNTTQQKNFFKSFDGHIWGANSNKAINTNEINGDLTDYKQIEKIIIDVGENKADLITADGGMEKSKNEDYILEEYNHFQLFLGEIITAVFVQKIEGTFILKMYDISYINSINLLHILNNFYTTVKIIKPYTSRPCNSEKYIKCTGFIGLDNIPTPTLEKIKQNLFKVLVNCKNTTENKYNHADIFKNFNLDNTNILEFNESIIVTTRELYTQHIYDILNTQNPQEMHLIKSYFKDTGKITNILENSDDTTKGYFVTKIENCIRLAQYLKLTNQLKPLFIDYYKNNKNNNKYLSNVNIYPPHFTEKYQIDSEKNPYEKTPKVIKFVEKYCILFNHFGENKILDEKIFRATYLFITNSKIKEIKHPLLESIRTNLNNKTQLQNILENLCKKQNIATTFNLYKTNTVNIIIKYQNNIRNLIGWYICKYTYIPMFPKYKIFDNVEDQIDVCGIKVNSHQYICCYSGDKLDKEDFDDFMGVGDSIHRTTVDLDENNKNMKNMKNTTKIQNILDSGDINKITDNLETTEELICFYILHNIFKIKDSQIIEHCLSNSMLINNSFKFTDISQEYKEYFDLLNDSYSNLSRAVKQKGLDKFETKEDKNEHYLKNKDFWHINKKTTGQLVIKLHIPPHKLDSFTNETIKQMNNTFLTKKNTIIYSTSLSRDTFIIQHLLHLYFSEYIYTEYINVILYTLSYISTSLNKKTSKDIINEYNKNEKNLLLYLYANTTEFRLFKQNRTSDYLMNIDIKQEINNSTTINDIKQQLEDKQLQLISEHINSEDNKWREFKTTEIGREQQLVEKLKELQNSTTVIEFLSKCFKIKGNLYVKFIEALKDINEEQNIFSKIDTSINYFPKNTFEELMNEMNDIMKGKPSLSINNNIESNIKSDRVDLNNNEILNYAKLRNTFLPDYEYDSNTTSLNYNFNSFMYYFKYLYLNVYEEDFPQFYGQQRYFKKVDDIYTCIYTNKTKKQILEDIQSKSTDLKTIYENLLNSKIRILNKSKFINKNILQNDNIYSSLINNTCYSFSLDNIDALYKHIILYYDEIKESVNDYDRNIIMRFYNDPVDNIIKFLEKHKEPFVQKFNKLTEQINTIHKLNDMGELYNIVSKIYTTEPYKINDEIVKLNTILIGNLKSKNIECDKLKDLSVRDLITIINNIKQKLSYISNFSNESQTFNNITIESDLKNKYRFIQQKYITDTAEYSVLIDLIKKFYNFNLDEYILNTLQVIFKHLLDLFNFYPNNIVFPVVITVNKNILLNKFYKIMNNCFDELNTQILVENNYFKQKFYLHTINNPEDKKYELIQKIPFEQTDKILPTREYIDLFKQIINDTITTVTDYSSIVDEFTEDMNIEDDGIENDDYVGVINRLDDIAGSVED